MQNIRRLLTLLPQFRHDVSEIVWEREGEILIKREQVHKG